MFRISVAENSTITTKPFTHHFIVVFIPVQSQSITKNNFVTWFNLNNTYDKDKSMYILIYTYICIHVYTNIVYIHNPLKTNTNTAKIIITCYKGFGR